MQNKSLTCKDCGTSFVFSVREQAFYAERGFENEPQRCKPCREQRKLVRETAAAGPQSHEIVCARCGVTTTVPFRPRGDRPVYCRTCFATHGERAAAS